MDEQLNGPICYLCGQQIVAVEDLSADHRMPKSMLSGAPPRRQGFDYGGKAPAHKTCKNHFREENFVATALRLLHVINTRPVFKISHPTDATLPIQIMAKFAQRPKM